VPFLRVVRDKRGYQTTYLMHWFRDGTRQRSKVLYLFRTPAGIRVGRESMEPEVRRAIEAQHPDIEFDWHAVMAGQQIIDASLDRRPRRPRADEGAPAPAASTPPRPSDAGSQVAPPERPRFFVPSEISGTTPDEQMAFLAHWYAAVRDHLSRQTLSEPRRTALQALNERMNPAAWTDADQIAAGLPIAAEALERLSRVFSRRRRRSRRGGSAPASGSPADTPAVES
jgi:hypothetical protein